MARDCSGLRKAVSSRSRLRAAIVILLMQVTSAHGGTLANGVLQHELQSLADRFDGGPPRPIVHHGLATR